MVGLLFHLADQARRQQGLLLHRLGLGPQSRPARTVQTCDAGRLLAYQPARRGAPSVLIVPAPIKTAYIWDLAPGASVVERCIEAGLQVYLMAWRRPAGADAWMGLAEYADQALAASVEAIGAETGEESVFLAGHSLGGTLAAIFASLHARSVRGLIVLEAPMAFGAGTMDMAVARSPHASTVGAVFGNVPGSFIDCASAAADPPTYIAQPPLDWLGSLSSPHAQRLHWQVRRWSLDETPLPRQLYEEVQELLYRENRFAKGELDVAGRRADPRAIDMPIFMVVDARSTVVPPASMEAYRSGTASPDVQVLDYGGDAGVVLQHVGVLVGPNAHASIWPRVVRWMLAAP